MEKMRKNALKRHLKARYVLFKKGFNFYLLLSFLLFCSSSLLYAQGVKLTIDFKNAKVEHVLDYIEQHTDYVFLYNDQVVPHDLKITIQEKEQSLFKVLSHIFVKTPISYTVKNKQIILSKKVETHKKDNLPITIKGTIVDSSKIPLIGVNVLVKGSTIGCVTDIDGHFTLQIPKEKSRLVIRYMGYKTIEMNTPESKQPLNITMYEDTEVLDEVVITAMGIERKAKSLTYATQQVNNKELTRSKSVNFINSLQGKTAGMTITPNVSGAGGGSSKIVLRGQSSILGNNQPLIVLDGIPLSSGMAGQTNNILNGASRDGGDLLSTINPDDIASMNILKGPNAAALYGSAANNGVIIITTKGGREGKIRVDVSSSTVFSTPNQYPKQQTVFAPEIMGSSIEYNAWGNKIADLTDDQLALYPFITRSPRDNVKDFFGIGQTYNNSISISGGSSKMSTYFSYANTTQQGLISNNKFYRHNFSFKQSYHALDDKLQIDLSINYISQKTSNSPIIGKAKGVMPGLYRTPLAVDMRYFDQNRTIICDKYNNLATMQNGNKHLIGVPVQNFPWLNQVWINNPYFMLDAIRDIQYKERTMLSSTIQYKINKDFSVKSRLSYDKVSDEGTSVEKSSIRRDKDQTTSAIYWGARSKRYELYGDALLSYSKKVSERVAVNATVGASTKRIKNRGLWVAKYNDTTYVAPNYAWPIAGANGSQYSGDRGRLDANDTDTQKNWESAVFATAQVGLDDKVFVDVSFRNDWSKAFQQFAKKNEYKSFAYYSVGMNALLNEIFVLPKVNELKVRASYSVVGNSVPNTLFAAQSYNPLNGHISSRKMNFDDPKPETTESIELGIDGRFLNNKLNCDLTFYQAVMKNQFMYISSASGVQKPVNSGKVRNRGIELSASYTFDFNRNFSWTAGFNMAYNDNEILRTYVAADGTPVEIQVGPKSLGIQSKYLEGGSYGDLYAKSFKWKDGKIMLTGVNNKATTDEEKYKDARPQLGNEYDRYIGNATAKYTYGWNNTINYKDFSLYFLIDGKIGGRVLSLTQAEMDQYGLSQRTADARLKNDGWVVLPDGQKVTARNYYETIGGEQYDCAYDATNARLREISLGYTFRNFFGISKNLSLSLVGRNLFFLYKKAPVDPDISVSAANGMSGIESFSLPTTRSYGLNIKLTF